MEKQITVTTAAVEAVKVFTANLFIDSELLVAQGDWEWEMQCENIFCSDVMIVPNEHFYGTRGIFHPDDVAEVKATIADRIEPEDLRLSFRMITSYGEVKTIIGRNIRFIKPDDEEPTDTGYDLLLKTWHELEVEKGFEKSQELRLMLEQFEKINNSGSWYINTVTGETSYSDQMFRVHELMPGSLNAHANTFVPFIHHSDKDIVKESVDSAFTARLPLQIEYRIITTSGKVRDVMHIAEWYHNFKGELVMIGMLKDNSIVNEQETELFNSTNDLLFHKQVLQFHEKISSCGYWYINLLTRQTYISDNYYRIHGLKPQSIPASIGIIVNYVHPDDREKMQSALHRMRSLQIAPDIDYRIIRPDGRVRHISQKAKLIIYAGDELIMSAIINDVTDSKLLGKKLSDRDNELHVKDFIHRQTEELAGIGSWTWDIDSEIIDCSEHMCRMLGYKRKTDLTLNQIIRGIHPDDRNKFLNEINRAVEEKTESGFNFRMLSFGELRQVKGFFKFIDFDEKKLIIGTLQDISLEYNMQKELYESIQISQLLTENLIDAIFLTDIENKVILWNKGAEYLFEQDQDDMLGRNFFDCFPDQRYDERIAQFNRALNGETINKSEVRISPKTLHNMFMIPVKNQEDNVMGILHVMQDVSEQVNMRNLLSERLSFTEKLLEQTVDRIIVFDKNLNFRFWNQKAEKHYHINSEYVTGKNILDVFPSIADDPIYQDLKKALKGETVYIGTYQLDENDVYEEAYLVPLTNERKEVTGVLWVVHDLTKDIILEKQNRKSIEILNSLNEYFLELDADSAIRFANKSLCDLLDRSHEELIGKNLWEVFPGNENSSFVEVIRKAITTGQEIKGEFTLPTSDIPVLVSITPGVDGTIVAFFDIRLLKEAEKELMSKNDQLLMQNTINAYAEQIGSFGTWNWDMDTNKAVYSDNMFRLFGLEPQCFEPLFDNILNFVHDEDREKVLNPAKDLIEGNPPAITEYRVIRKDGVQRIFRNMAQIVNHIGHRIVIGTTHDITEQKENL